VPCALETRNAHHPPNRQYRRQRGIGAQTLVPVLPHENFSLRLLSGLKSCRKRSGDICQAAPTASKIGPSLSAPKTEAPSRAPGTVKNICH